MFNEFDIHNLIYILQTQLYIAIRAKRNKNEHTKTPTLLIRKASSRLAVLLGLEAIMIIYAVVWGIIIFFFLKKMEISIDLKKRNNNCTITWPRMEMTVVVVSAFCKISGLFSLCLQSFSRFDSNSSL